MAFILTSLTFKTDRDTYCFDVNGSYISHDRGFVAVCELKDGSVLVADGGNIAEVCEDAVEAVIAHEARTS